VETDTRDVRAGEALEWPRLVAWLRERLPACDIPGLDVTGEPEVTQFPGGHSNLTYLIRFGGADIVVRRPPFGPLPPTAHDMAREFRWLSALHGVFPLAPRPYLLCEDPSVIGSVFYAMERRHGVVVRAQEPPALADNPAARRALSGAFIDTLADLHAYPMFAYLLLAPEGRSAISRRPAVERWLRRMAARPAVSETRTEYE